MLVLGFDPADRRIVYASTIRNGEDLFYVAAAAMDFLAECLALDD